MLFFFSLSVWVVWLGRNGRVSYFWLRFNGEVLLRHVSLSALSGTYFSLCWSNILFKGRGSSENYISSVGFACMAILSRCQIPPR